MSSLKPKFLAALVWTMVPLTVFGGLPRMGCICANGQHKFFCERASSAREGLCRCCFGEAAKPSRSEQDGNRTLKSCCRHKRAVSTDGSAVLGTDRPCRPVLDYSTFVNGPRTALDLDCAGHTPLFVAFEPLPARVSTVAHDCERGALLPPPDLVVTLGVLLI